MRRCMNIALFYHTLVSDWNHGNAHFLRGVASELIARGHEVRIFEPKNSWSRLNLVAEYGEKPIKMFREAYPALESTAYDIQSIDLDRALEGTDLVIVHEWNDHGLVQRIGEHRRKSAYKLLFHDTHHRMITARQSMDAYDLSHYDGVLAYGQVLADIYRETGRVRRVWTWHEAADTRVFKPLPSKDKEGDLVWVGNWGDDERTQELHEFLIDPAKDLRLNARVYGVRYPAEAQQALGEANMQYGGWLPNFEAPTVFSRFRFTVHVPRRPYVQVLRGIPTIRPFEALACGIPLICSPWNDAENLFTPEKDYLVAHNGHEMRDHMRSLMNDPSLAQSLATHGLRTVQSRHTCKHRVDELMELYQQLS
jgi:spore maturation protein CgeB